VNAISPGKLAILAVAFVGLMGPLVGCTSAPPSPSDDTLATTPAPTPAGHVPTTALTGTVAGGQDGGRRVAPLENPPSSVATPGSVPETAGNVRPAAPAPSTPPSIAHARSPVRLAGSSVARPPIMLSPSVDLAVGTYPVKCELYRSSDPYDVAGVLYVSVPVTITPNHGRLTYTQHAYLDGLIIPDGSSGSDSGTHTVSWSAGRIARFGGVHSVLVTLDPRNEVRETNENNNRVVVRFSLPAQRPALQAEQHMPVACAASRV